ncbi:cholinephosphotransferase 1 [Gracilinanus agilis]|uniref:cholinephosphotransferase 1 n=1 Tax=Gracilinanus agilis TaxID=191870 RepID=UPI001CFD8728|nr:cholinephosphotransferase 1 [Gracilinanus agilis]
MAACGGGCCGGSCCASGQITGSAGRGSFWKATASPLSLVQLRRLEEHRYSAEGSSLFEPVLQPFWSWLVELVPLWMAPNAITLLGLLLNLLSSLLLVFYCPTVLEEVRPGEGPRDEERPTGTDPLPAITDKVHAERPPTHPHPPMPHQRGGGEKGAVPAELEHPFCDCPRIQREDPLRGTKRWAKAIVNNWVTMAPMHRQGIEAEVDLALHPAPGRYSLIQLSSSYCFVVGFACYGHLSMCHVCEGVPPAAWIEDFDGTSLTPIAALPGGHKDPQLSVFQGDVFVSLGAAIATRLGTDPEWLFFCCFVGMFMFYCAHWQTYVSGVLRFGRVDVTEVQIAITIVFFITAIGGTMMWDYTIPVIQLKLKMLPLIGILTGAFISCFNYFQVILGGGVGKNGSTTAGTSVLSPGIHIGVIILLAIMIHKKSATQLFEKHPCLYILMFGCVYAKITQKLVVAHMTKSKLKLQDSAFIGPALLFFDQYFNHVIDEYIVLWVAMVSEHFSVNLLIFL